MKRLQFNLGAMFIIMGCLFSCSTDDGSSDCPEDFSGALVANEEKLVGEWTLTAIDADEAIDITDDDDDNPSTDLFAQYNDCQKDASYTFNSDRTYTYEQGVNETNCPDRATVSGSWQLASNTLGIVLACNLQNLNITFNASDTAFSFSNNFNVTDIEGNMVVTDITFTYSLTQ